jgi:hypothetical protein
MSVQTVLQAALAEALAGLEVTQVFDAPPVRAARPYALIEEAWLTDWGAKDMAGREGRFAVRLFDAGERPARLRALCGEAEARIEAMPRAIGDGWAIASLVLLRSRIAREEEGRWTATSEFRVRMLRSEL